MWRWKRILKIPRQLSIIHTGGGSESSARSREGNDDDVVIFGFTRCVCVCVEGASLAKFTRGETDTHPHKPR